MEAAEIASIKRTTTVNIVLLSLRNIGLQAISFVGFFILTILLGTGEVGLFAIVSESVGILGYFSDVGLASALIQKKTEVTLSELRTTFLVQQILVALALIIVAIFYPSLSLNKGYGSKELWIVISLCYAFAAASLKTIPSVLLERQLNFKILSTVDIVENICFYVFAVIFAYFGYGVYAYAIATFIRSTFGLILIYYFHPWSIGFSFSFNSAKQLFKYGVPFQLNSFIAVAKDRLSNLLVAGIIGRDAFGILSWAQKGPRVPLSFMDAIMRVTFPTFARIQDEPEFLRRSLQKSIYYIAFFVFPALTVIALVAPDFINFIPRYTKWSPAIIPLYFYTLSFAIAAITTPLTNAFNAVGKITVTTKLMIMWTILTWIFYPLLSLQFGYIGTSVAVLVVGSSSFIVWYLAHQLFRVNVFQTILHPSLACFFIILFSFPFNHFSFSPLINIISKSILSLIIYSIYHYYFSRSEINWFIKEIRCLTTKK